ncbi:MAG TPA: homocysteine S-methyltransferase family protein [Beijerinckiaceae bacterium]|jgi:homocysteine S-methyltransferase|nr:homocysteine S-methyltransferase family protein [Beijerinckiaceae bacterium]
MKLTDGGIETVLIFDEGIQLPCFAAFHLLRTAEGTEALRAYYEPYLELAREHGMPFVLCAPTWRSSPDWGRQLGYAPQQLAEANRRAVELMHEMRAANPDLEIVVDAVIGPRGDGYLVGEVMTAPEAEAYHAVQIAALTGADTLTALTLTYADEAIGIVRAARAAGLPVVVSFTVETDGRLPSGEPLRDAIERTDAEAAPDSFMVNCAHPEHFADVLDGDWAHRIRGVRANASRKSHAELDVAATLDTGDPAELGALYAQLRQRLPQLELVGGCCGTDHRHIAAIAEACNP